MHAQDKYTLHTYPAIVLSRNTIMPAQPLFPFSHGPAGRCICLQTQLKFNQNLLPMRKEN